MKISQLSVFLENRKGRLYEVCELLGQGGVNIRALNIAETTDFGILRIVVDQPEAALQLLREHHFVANVTDIVAVEVNDRPGGLAAVLRVLSQHDINVEYMYAFAEKKSDQALVVFRFEDPEKAIRVLTENHIAIARQTDLLGA